MERTGYIEIHVYGKQGSLELSPDNYDIKDIIEVMQQAQALLFPNMKKERPLITYDIQEGSVKHIFKTTFQAVLGFSALLTQIQKENYGIDFLNSTTASAFEFFKTAAQKNNYQYIIQTSLPQDDKLIINRDTKFIRAEDSWVHTELYLYGTIEDAGGKNKANIHLDTPAYGLLKIDTTKELLGAYQNNILYKEYGVRVRGKQNVKTGEIEKTGLELIEIIDYNPLYEEDYLQSLIQKAEKSWSGVQDTDEWINQLRGYGA